MRTELGNTNQGKFIHKIKFYQQSLEQLEETVTEIEKEKIAFESKRFLQNMNMLQMSLTL